jgi:hypothetical protein
MPMAMVMALWALWLWRWEMVSGGIMAQVTGDR